MIVMVGLSVDSSAELCGLLDTIGQRVGRQ